MHSLTCNHCGEPFESSRRRKFCSVTCRNRANNDAASQRLQAETKVIAWSCGGGVDSTVIAALIVTGKLPKPDFAYMTDAGWERDSTWDYVNNVLVPRLAAAGVALQIIKTSNYTDSDLVDGRGYVTIPAYRRTAGGMGKLGVRCNNRWKVVPARRWLREQGVKRCENWIGISADDRRRARHSRLKWIEYRYPLIDLEMTREDGLWFLASHGWPRPHRTSCVICPNQSDTQWHELRERPNERAKVLEAERLIQQEVGANIYLHRSGRPIAEVIG